MTSRIILHSEPTNIFNPRPATLGAAQNAPSAEVNRLGHGVACVGDSVNDATDTWELLADAEITGRASRRPSLAPMGMVVGQAVMNAGATVAAFSSAAQSTWQGDPFNYRAWAVGGLVAACVTAVVSPLADASGLARRLMAKSTCPALLGCWAAGALQNGLDTLPNLPGAERDKVVFQIAASATMLAIAFGFQLASIAKTAKKAQARLGDVPGIAGHGAKAALAYAGVSAAMALSGTTMGLVARQHRNEPGRVAAFSLAGLAAVPALMALMVATRSGAE